MKLYTMIVMLQLHDLFTSQLIVLGFANFAGVWIDYPCQQRQQIIQLQPWGMERTMVVSSTEGYRVVGLAQTRYTYLDPGLLSTFVERWYGDTGNFHMPCGEMRVTLDDVRCLLHLPIQGRLLDHSRISNKATNVEWMITLIGLTNSEAEGEVRRTKGAHVRVVYWKNK
jgi:hypothetical protein